MNMSKQGTGAKRMRWKMLPNGLKTKDHKLWSIMDDHEVIGMLWVYIKSNNRDKQAFIYDIELDDNQQGKGYGKATMTRLEESVRAEGVSQIGLHVFAHNKRALALYQKMGYEAASYNMVKRI